MRKNAAKYPGQRYAPKMAVSLLTRMAHQQAIITKIGTMARPARVKMPWNQPINIEIRLLENAIADDT